MLYLGFLAALAAILLGAHLFTAGVERLGSAWGLGRGVMGNLLAAVGTALPESILPLVAFIWGGQEGEAIGTGAILGAPLMLSTVAMALLGVVALITRRRGADGGPDGVHPDPLSLRRDLRFFIIAALIGLLVARLGTPGARVIGALVLVAWYGLYVVLTMAQSSEEVGWGRVSSFGADASIAWGGLWRLACGLIAMVLAAHQFVSYLERMASHAGVSAFVFATLLAPVATELPEKFASVLWLLRRQDDLAVANVTGAMVFQATLIPAMGMTLTSWRFGAPEYLVLVLALLAGCYLRWLLQARRGLPALGLIGVAVLYGVYIFMVTQVWR